MDVIPPHGVHNSHTNDDTSKTTRKGSFRKKGLHKHKSSSVFLSYFILHGLEVAFNGYFFTQQHLELSGCKRSALISFVQLLGVADWTK